ncbi:MFS transporter, partial [Corynebacterium bovis]|uniref:MFS transporter n=1 Tax=Corynebacterium bovis TaxID=36808 RepID=UPI00313A1300
MSRRPPAAAPPGDAAMTRVIWPALAAAALGLVPFTVFSTFLVGIADDAGADATVLGGLRGLGGVAALATGVACAPLIDRLPRRTVAAGALVVLALACAAGVLGQTWSWVVFCLLVGGGTATLTPAVTAAASDAFPDDATAGRAATLVSSTTTLTAMLAAPLLAGPALLWGWRGDLVAVAVLCVVAAVVGTGSVTGLFLAPVLPVALAMTSLTSVAHGDLRPRPRGVLPGLEPVRALVLPRQLVRRPVTPRRRRGPHRRVHGPARVRRGVLQRDLRPRPRGVLPGLEPVRALVLPRQLVRRPVPPRRRR